LTRHAPQEETTVYITEAQIESYEEDGFLFLSGVIEPRWLDLMARAHERDLAHVTPWAVTNIKAGHHRFVLDTNNFSVNAEWQELLYESPVVDIMAEAIRTDQIWLYYDQIFYKEGAAFPTGFHQDLSYYNMVKGEKQAIGAWISLDPVPQQFSLEMVRGSHKGPLYHGGSTKSLYAVGFEFDLGEGPMPDVASHKTDFDIVAFESNPGDLILLHPQLLHGGAPTEPGRSRRTLTINVFGPDTAYYPRPPGHTPNYPGIDRVLKPGDKLCRAAEPYFPQLRPVPAVRRKVLAQHDMDYSPIGGPV
jgi:ectoine hydroxylase-related dioxygenase (phytanoyl-CoA dioxygenase family)